jgi:hypothetical protein
MLNYGSPFHKVAGVFAVPTSVVGGDDASVACSIEYASTAPCDLTVRLFIAGHERSLGRIVTSATDDWQTYRALASDISPATDGVVNVSGAHGTGAIVVAGARFVNAAGEEAHILEHGMPAHLDIDVAVFRPDLRERCQVVVALHRDGIEDVCRYITRDLAFDAAVRPRGTIRLTIPRLTLTNGTYSITIMIAKEGYYDTDQTLFYSINPSVYCCVSRLFDVSVVGAGLIGAGTRHVLDGEWSQS